MAIGINFTTVSYGGTWLIPKSIINYYHNLFISHIRLYAIWLNVYQHNTMNLLGNKYNNKILDFYINIQKQYQSHVIFCFVTC